MRKLLYKIFMLVIFSYSALAQEKSNIVVKDYVKTTENQLIRLLPHEQFNANVHNGVYNKDPIIQQNIDLYKPFSYNIAAIVDQGSDFVQKNIDQMITNCDGLFWYYENRVSYFESVRLSGLMVLGSGVQDFFKYFDYHRYAVAFRKVYKPQTSSSDQNLLKSIISAYKREKKSWLGNLYSIEEGKSLSHKIIDEPFKIHHYTDSELEKDPNLDATIAYILYKIQTVNTIADRNRILKGFYTASFGQVGARISWKYDLYQDKKLSELKELKNKFQKTIESENIKVKKCSQWNPDEQISKLKYTFDHLKNNIIYDSDPENFKKGIASHDPIYLELYITNTLLKFEAGNENLFDNYGVFYNTRISAEYLYCLNKLTKNSPVITAADRLLVDSVSKYKVQQCSDETVNTFTGIYNERKTQVENLAKVLPSKAAEPKEFEYETRFRNRDMLSVSKVLGKIGSDLISESLFTLDVLDNMYSLNITDEDIYGDLCNGYFDQKGTVSDYCRSFKNFAIYRYNEIKKTNNLGSKPVAWKLYQCGGEDKLRWAVNQFLPEHINEYMTIKFGSGKFYKDQESKIKEELMKAIFNRIEDMVNQTNSEEFMGLVPLMYTEKFVNQFDIGFSDPDYLYQSAGGALGSGGIKTLSHYKTLKLIIKPQNCDVLKSSLKETLLQNIAFVAAPDSYTKVLGISFENTGEYLARWFSSFEQDFWGSMAKASSGRLIYDTILGNSPQGTIDIYGESPFFAQEPQKRFKHLVMVLKNRTFEKNKDQINPYVAKYLIQMPEEAELLCRLDKQIKHELYIQDPEYRRVMKVVRGIGHAAAVAVTVASWVIPGAGPFVTYASMATFATSVGTGLISIDEASRMLNLALQQKSLIYENCINDLVTRVPEKDEMLHSASCYMVKTILEEVDAVSSLLREEKISLALEVGMFSIATIKEFKIFKDYQHSQHGVSDAAKTAKFAKLSESFKGFKKQLGSSIKTAEEAMVKFSAELINRAHKIFGNEGQLFEWMKAGKWASIRKMIARGNLNNSLQRFLGFAKNGTKIYIEKKIEDEIKGQIVNKVKDTMVEDYDEQVISEAEYRLYKAYKINYYVSIGNKAGNALKFDKNSYKMALMMVLLEEKVRDFRENSNSITSTEEIDEKTMQKWEDEIYQRVATMSNTAVKHELDSVL